jgi:hypothetical protein
LSAARAVGIALHHKGISYIATAINHDGKLLQKIISELAKGYKTMNNLTHVDQMHEYSSIITSSSFAQDVRKCIWAKGLSRVHKFERKS